MNPRDIAGERKKKPKKTSYGKKPSTGGSDEDQPVMLHHAGQQAQHTADWAVPAMLEG